MKRGDGSEASRQLNFFISFDICIIGLVIDAVMCDKKNATIAVTKNINIKIIPPTRPTIIVKDSTVSLKRVAWGTINAIKYIMDSYCSTPREKSELFCEKKLRTFTGAYDIYTVSSDVSFFTRVNCVTLCSPLFMSHRILLSLCALVQSVSPAVPSCGSPKFLNSVSVYLVTIMELGIIIYSPSAVITNEDPISKSSVPFVSSALKAISGILSTSV
mmetsp:Transcript_14012/g.20702  ORF Transcript_14012/g.20702 Transcript_14012/m.20702 type:complete len:216 (-) Transcript_14012:1071-1718(-)